MTKQTLRQIYEIRATDKCVCLSLRTLQPFTKVSSSLTEVQCDFRFMIKQTIEKALLMPYAALVWVES